MGISGKGGIPKYKSNDKLSSIVREGKEVTLINNVNNPICEIEPHNKKVKIKLTTQSYIPIEVYKIFVKMAISVMCYDSIKYFNQVIKWILEEQNTNLFQNMAKCMQTTILGANSLQTVSATLLFRKNDNLEVPFCQFVICFNQFMFQIIVPSPMQDKFLRGKTINLKFFPSTFEIVNPYFTQLSRQFIDLQSIEKCNQEKMVHLNYESAEFPL